METMRSYIVQCLEGYREMERQINLLQFELSSTNQITPDEMIEAMVFSKNETSAGSKGHVSDKTASVALTYLDKTKEANLAVRMAIVDYLRPLLIRKDRMDHCLAQLRPVYKTVLNALYVQQKSIKALATDMHLSESTIQRYREHAIGELVAMYEMLEKAGVALE